MQPTDLDQLSWISVPTEELDPLLGKLGFEPAGEGTLSAADLRRACDGDGLIAVVHDGWAHLFGENIGTGTLAREAAVAYGHALAFENDQNKQLIQCAQYVGGIPSRQVSSIQGELAYQGAPAVGEPAIASLDSEAVAALAECWGASPTLLTEGMATVSARAAAKQATPAPPQTARQATAPPAQVRPDEQPETGSQGLMLFAVAAVVLVLLIGVAGAGMIALSGNSEDPCVSKCERQAKRDLADHPACKGSVIEQCASYIEAVDGCRSVCAAMGGGAEQ